MTALNDSWETPSWLFEELNHEFNFDIDLCATESNSKCDDFCYDYLQDIIGRKESNCIGRFQDEIKKDLIKSAFLNPPYSRGSMEKFIGKAWEDSKYCKIVCLVKCDPSTKWWSIFYDAVTWEPRPGCVMRFLPKRVKFNPPQGWDGKASGPSFPSAVLIFDRRWLFK